MEDRLMGRRIVRSMRPAGRSFDVETLRELTTDGAIGLIDAGVHVFRVERVTDPDVLKAPDAATALEEKVNFDPQVVLDTILVSLPNTEERDEALYQLYSWLANGGWAPRVRRRTAAEAKQVTWRSSDGFMWVFVPVNHHAAPALLTTDGSCYLLQWEE